MYLRLVNNFVSNLFNHNWFGFMIIFTKKGQLILQFGWPLRHYIMGWSKHDLKIVKKMKKNSNKFKNFILTFVFVFGVTKVGSGTLSVVISTEKWKKVRFFFSFFIFFCLLLLAANSSISALAIAWLKMSIFSGCCEGPWDSNSLLDEPFESKTTQEESPGTENEKML